jgi:UDP:flavonoid glycosyltransferase YjiC (YdhE family)
MPRANVVVCAGGVNSLYEALWAGCRVVCVPQSDEEKVRLIHATRAGEAVVTMTEGFEEAVSRVRGMVPLGRRPSGVTEAVAMIMAPNE